MGKPPYFRTLQEVCGTRKNLSARDFGCLILFPKAYPGWRLHPLPETQERSSRDCVQVGQEDDGKCSLGWKADNAWQWDTQEVVGSEQSRHPNTELQNERLGPHAPATPVPFKLPESL